jgi:hypothetical protein
MTLPAAEEQLKIGMPKFSSVCFLRISLNLEPDFKFSSGNLLNFELDHQFKVQKGPVQVQVQPMFEHGTKLFKFKNVCL